MILWTDSEAFDESITEGGHNDIIVKIRHIDLLKKDCITLRNGGKIRISCSKYKNVKEKMADYWREMR